MYECDKNNGKPETVTTLSSKKEGMNSSSSEKNGNSHRPPIDPSSKRNSGGKSVGETRARYPKSKTTEKVQSTRVPPSEELCLPSSNHETIDDSSNWNSFDRCLMELLKLKNMKDLEAAKHCVTLLKAAKGRYSDINSLMLVKTLEHYGTGSETNVDRLATVLRNEGFIDGIVIKLLNLIKESEMKLDTETNDIITINFFRCLTIMMNLTKASPEFCGTMLDLPVLKICLEMLADPRFTSEKISKYSHWAACCLISCVLNVCQHVDASKVLRDANAVIILEHLLETDENNLKVPSLLVLSFVVNDEENKRINRNSENIQCLVHSLKNSIEREERGEFANFSVSDLLAGLNKFAVNDSNKKMIVECGALPLYAKCLERENQPEQASAVQGIWTLAFTNQEDIQNEKGVVKGLKKLAKGPTSEISENAKGALVALRDKETIDDLKKSVEKSIKTEPHGVKHVMISYQWDNQETMKWVKDGLKEAGYHVWMDIERMEGSILEAMAEAVENSAVVLVCMSQKYQDSKNCRTEAEYAFHRHKDVIPLLLQPKFQACGWLGAMLGTKKYFNFTGKASWKKRLQELISELKNRGKSNSEVCRENSQAIQPSIVETEIPRQNEAHKTKEDEEGKDTLQKTSTEQTHSKDPGTSQRNSDYQKESGYQQTSQDDSQRRINSMPQRHSSASVELDSDLEVSRRTPPRESNKYTLIMCCAPRAVINYTNPPR